MRLHEIVETLDDKEREQLRVRLDGRDFSIPSDEYNIRRETEIEDYGLKENPDNFLLMLVCSSQKKLPL